MTDVQLLTLAMAVLIPLSMLLHSNSRITDTKETLRAEIRAETQTLKAEIQALRAEVQSNHALVMATLDKIVLQVKGIETNLESKLKIHELEHHR